jgi:uncharacterized LabA/DUF88 family protein
MTYMKNVLNGQKLKRAVICSGFTKEQVVASVQDKGLRFSLAGLDKMYRGELPVRDPEEILRAIADKCGCETSDFAEFEIKTA